MYHDNETISLKVYDRWILAGREKEGRKKELGHVHYWRNLKEQDIVEIGGRVEKSR